MESGGYDHGALAIFQRLVVELTQILQAQGRLCTGPNARNISVIQQQVRPLFIQFYKCYFKLTCNWATACSSLIRK